MQQQTAPSPSRARRKGGLHNLRRWSMAIACPAPRTPRCSAWRSHDAARSRCPGVGVYTEDRGLHFVKAAVTTAWDRHLVLLSPAVLTQLTDARREFVIIGDHCAAITQSTEIFGGV